MSKGKTKRNGYMYVPVTPGDTPLPNLASDFLEGAIDNLLEDAKHMPYGTWDNFVKRGYSIEEWPEEAVW